MAVPQSTVLPAGFDPAAHIVDTGDDFRVSGAVYTDPEVFGLEMRHLFARTWIFIGHESEIPEPGDFKTAYIGLRPVIMSRSADREVHVLLNRCRHRGSVVCREARGNVKRFSCPYHGWVYDLDGSLRAIAKHRGGYPDDIDKSALGLLSVPRVYSYRGLVFANLDPDALDFLDYLGPAREFLDIHLDRSPVGTINVRYGAHRTEYRGNWKFQCENSTDGYHGDTVHASFFKVVAEFGNRGGQHGAYTQKDFKQIIEHRTTGRTMGFDHGHGIWESPMTPEAVAAMRAGPHGEYVRQLETVRGPEAVPALLNSMNLLIFPSLAVLHGQLRVIRPIAPDRTEVAIHFYDLDGVPAAYNEFRLNGYHRFFGPAGFGSPDDVEIFSLNQTGLQAEEVEWLLLSRGLARETVSNRGVRTGDPTDETPQRAFHRAWKRAMAS